MFRINISRHGTVVKSTPEAAHDNGDLPTCLDAAPRASGGTHALKEAT